MRKIRSNLRCQVFMLRGINNSQLSGIILLKEWKEVINSNVKYGDVIGVLIRNLHLICTKC